MGDKRFNIGLPDKLGNELSKDFELNEEFFEFVGDVLIESCFFKVSVSVKRKHSFWDLEVKVDGFLQTFCDRCGDNLKVLIKGKDLYFLKAQERNKNFHDENIIFISSKKTDFNLKPLLEEACFLLFPVTRKHKIENCNKKEISKLDDIDRKINGQKISSKILKDLKEKLKK